MFLMKALAGESQQNDLTLITIATGNIISEMLLTLHKMGQKDVLVLLWIGNPSIPKFK